MAGTASIISCRFSEAGEFVSAAGILFRSDTKIVDYLSPIPLPKFDRKYFPKPLVSIFTLAGAIIGLSLAYLFQYWTHATDYRINVSGKPFFSWIFSVPVAFETAIFTAALFTFFGFLYLAFLKKDPIKDNINHLEFNKDNYYLFIENV